MSMTSKLPTLPIQVTSSSNWRLFEPIMVGLGGERMHCMWASVQNPSLHWAHQLVAFRDLKKSAPALG